MKLLPVAITLSLFAVLFAATGRTSSSAAYDPTMPIQQTYELRCRGGGLKFNSTSGGPSSSGEQMMNLTVNFTAGT